VAMWRTSALFGVSRHREAPHLRRWHASDTQVPWCRLAARVLLDHAPDAGGVVVLCGLGYARPLDYVDGCRGVVSLRVAFDHTPDAVVSWRCVV
jgi:hypothetical protein